MLAKFELVLIFFFLNPQVVQFNARTEKKGFKLFKKCGAQNQSKAEGDSVNRLLKLS